MTTPVIKAEGFIWLIVGIFWVIAQIAGAAAKKNRPQRPFSETGEPREVPEDPLAELLRKMAGAEQFRAGPPESAQESEPDFAAATPWKPGDIEALPDIKPLFRAPPAPEPDAGLLNIPEIDIRPKMSAFRQSVPAIRLPAMSRSFQGVKTSARSASDTGMILNSADRRSLRQAMLGHIIFSPPKAFEKTGN